MPRSLLPLALWICVNALVANTAMADLSDDLARCHQIAEPQQRLNCYDQISGRASADDSPAGHFDHDHSQVADQVEVILPEADLNEPAFAVSAEAGGSFLNKAWAQGADDDVNLILPHRFNYFLLGRYSSAVNQRPYSPLAEAFDEDNALDSTEAKYQISFKARLWANKQQRLGLWFAYTQQSQWQVYNGALSRPFRETNYQPELIATYWPGLSVAGFDWNLLAAGITHQSNGRSEPLSRSWDRVFIKVGVERDNFGLLARVWQRIPESISSDDNPDITDYYGHGQLTAYTRLGGHGLSLMVRGNPRTGKGAAELSWVSPPVLGPLRGYVQVFSGYGESLIDYNWNQNTVGAGLSLNDLF